jgi:AraC-like DNA-binding protein
MYQADIAYPLQATISKLLSDAEAALGRDVESAKRCLTRALALLETPAAANDPELPGLPVVTARGGLSGWQIRRVSAYIDAHLGCAIKVRDLVALTRLSSSHFAHAFKESFGEAPFGHITQRRMQRAQELMLTTGEPLAQIALACGLYDQAHFTRVFRRVVGVSPNVWRRRYATGPVSVP